MPKIQNCASNGMCGQKTQAWLFIYDLLTEGAKNFRTRCALQGIEEYMVFLFHKFSYLRNFSDHEIIHCHPPRLFPSCRNDIEGEYGLEASRVRKSVERPKLCVYKKQSGHPLYFFFSREEHEYVQNLSLLPVNSFPLPWSNQEWPPSSISRIKQALKFFEPWPPELFFLNRNIICRSFVEYDKNLGKLLQCSIREQVSLD